MLPLIIKQQPVLPTSSSTITTITTVFNSSIIDETFKIFKDLYDSKIFQNIYQNQLSNTSSLFSIISFIFLIALLTFFIFAFVYFSIFLKKKNIFDKIGKILASNYSYL